MHRSARRIATSFLVPFVLVALTSCGDSEEKAPPTEAAQEEDFENPCDPSAPAKASELEGDRPKAGANLVTVTAVEYAFQGVQDQYAAGEYGFKLMNGGQEAHELAVVKVKEGEARPLAEIMQLPEEEQEKAAEYLGGTVACPGKEAEALGVTFEKGRYGMICFIPEGLTPQVRKEDADKLGKPHFTRGMVKEITIA